MTAPSDLFAGQATKAIVEAAHEEIANICTGKRRWTMSVPARATDSDLLISEALNRLEDVAGALLAHANPTPPGVLDKFYSDGAS